MDYVIFVAIIGLFAGVFGTFGGSVFILLLKEISDRLLTFSLGISGGIMTVIVFVDLIPEALKVGTPFITMLGLFLGVILIFILDLSFSHQHFLERPHEHYLKAGLLLATGIALHNLPEGLAIGAGYIAASSLGLGLAIIMGLHNFPEGMAIATTLSLAGMKNWQIILITLFSGIPMGIGAFLGAYLGEISDFFLSLALGLAAGAMLYITFDELIPGAHEKNQGKIAIIGILTGVFLGLLLTEYLY